jgi:hypothetical protein
MTERLRFGNIFIWFDTSSQAKEETSEQNHRREEQQAPRQSTDGRQDEAQVTKKQH